MNPPWRLADSRSNRLPSRQGKAPRTCRIDTNSSLPSIQAFVVDFVDLTFLPPQWFVRTIGILNISAQKLLKASLFIDLEAHVAEPSDDEPDFDSPDDIINDEDVDDAESTGPAPSLFTEDDGPRSTRFIEELERRYTQPSVSDRERSSSLQGSDPAAVSEIALGKRKASEVDDLDEMHPVIRFAARQSSPPPAFAGSTTALSSSTSRVTARPVHPMTKTRLPVRESPIFLPDHKRLLETNPATVENFGLWKDGPPLLARPKTQEERQTRFVKRNELSTWSRWAEREEQIRKRTDYAPGEWVQIRRGTYKGDTGQIWRPQVRPKSDEEVEAEERSIEHALEEGRATPEPTPEFVFEGFWVLVVPRLPPPHLTQPKSLKLKPSYQTSKRRRYPPRVFYPSEYEIEIPKKLSDRTQGVAIDGQILSHGLLLKLFKMDALDPASAVSPESVAAFEQHPHSKRFPFPIPAQWHIGEGDEVDVNVSEHDASQSGRGVVHSCEAGGFLVDYGAAGIHPASVERVLKVIAVGDYVKVVGGADTGKEGLVVEKHGSIVAISENGSRRGIDLFLHVNSLARHARKFDWSSIPWLDHEVTIIKGPNHGRHGIVKDVTKKPNRATLSLWLYLPHVGTTFEVDDTKVVAKGTRNPLWKAYPLHPSHRYYNMPRVELPPAVQVPWLGLYVGIIKGHHKGKEGTVKDVNRTQNRHSRSGLMVTVELNLMGSPQEQVYYDYVRERSTGCTLAGFHALDDKQGFFKPNPKFVGAGVTWQKRPSKVLALVPGEGGIIDQSSLTRPPGDSELSFTQTRDEGDESIPDVFVDPSAPMDIWNPYYDEVWCYPGSGEPPPPPSPPPPLPVQQGPSTASFQDKIHALARPELVGITVLVDITHGHHKKAGAFVKLVRTATGAIVGNLKKGKGNHIHEIPLTSIVQSWKRVDNTKDDHLLVVTKGQDVGKFVRRICHFFVGSESVANKWLVLAVVDKDHPVDKFTGQVIEASVGELAFVEEESTARFRATHILMKRLRDEARLKMTPTVRGPGEESLQVLIDFVGAEMARTAR
ncbi:hypothetical protein V5O48_010384 [Marasmius crinis-equi]|uniref:KOW domain-containing protein n=1 Tax=Marasmius crinis-equi TaxID=585013 RepID=A0ABR3F8J7_9AGAR